MKLHRLAVPIPFLFMLLSGLKWLQAAETAPAAPPKPPAEASSPAAANPATAPVAPAPAGAPANMGRGRMRGEVGLSRREKITGAVVAITRQGDEANLFATTTDPFGVFQFESLPEGNYTVIALKDGLLPARKEGIEVRAPFRADVEVLMTPGAAPPPVVGSAAPSAASGDSAAAPADAGTIRLTVVSAGGTPVEGARLNLRALAGTSDPIRGQTDGEGRFEFARPPAGEYFLRLEAPGYLPIHLDRAALGLAFRSVRVFLTSRPFDYPGTAADLLPDEKPVPPVDLATKPAPVPAQTPANAPPVPAPAGSIPPAPPQPPAPAPPPS
jgi:hypothetical protein